MDVILKKLGFFVTDRCNLKCKHCFVPTNKTRSNRELSLSEIKKIAASFQAPLELLSLTGGEPFLREDLPQIAKAFYKLNGSKEIFICTNGLMSGEIARQMSKIVDDCACPILVQVSIDGFAPTHDSIRSVPGSFSAALETVSLMKELQRQSTNLGVAVLTVVHEGNIDEMEELSEYLAKEIGVEQHLMIMRQIPGTIWGLNEETIADLKPTKLKLPPIKKLEKMDRYFRKKGKYRDRSHLFKRLTYQIKMLKTGKPIFSSCSAGQDQGILYADGAVALCEFTRPVGNVRDHDLCFPKVWRSKAAEEMRRRITKCYCIHDCFFIDNLKRYLEVQSKSGRSGRGGDK
ncbi:MAG: radical SAM protein [Candidatus Saganbacteria bacterium]|nr:radical SAM protein [Candidatus Saganbacteria bacterium]